MDYLKAFKGLEAEDTASSPPEVVETRPLEETTVKCETLDTDKNSKKSQEKVDKDR